MSKIPVFSVVMPMYNVSKYVRTAINSVLSQSYTNFELICVDDGCTDRTVSIVESYSDERIRIVRQENRGLAAARNTGINHARGLYVALLDSDDWWHKDKLLQHMRHFCGNPLVDVSYSASRFVDEEGEDMGIGQYPKIKDISDEQIFCRNPVGNGSAAIIRRSVFMKIGSTIETENGVRLAYFDESMRQSEDIDFWVRLSLSTHAKFEGLSQALTYYRVNGGGLSANLNKQYNAWKYSVEKNWDINPSFFNKWFSRAAAYQKRYLARRAIQSRQAFSALKLAMGAIATDWRILKEEPKRTVLTLGCAMLAFLPPKIYAAIERQGMLLLGKQT